jgi:hypothetical protein
MARYLFFKHSRSTFVQVSELFNFIWPTAAALWNLRWQVGGLCQVLPSVTKETLHGRFVYGSGIQSANLQRACIELTWDEQQAEFAKFVLFNVFAIYEGWLALTLAEIGMSSLGKDLQFPTSTGASGAIRGLGNALAQIRSNTSSMLKDAFYVELTAHPKNSLPKIENLLKAYRCFKEYRNTLMHGGGNANQKCVDDYREYSTLTTSDLGISEVPKVIPPSLGRPVSLSLRGVVGFSEIVQRLVATLDAELACTRGAERHFLSLWHERFSESGKTKVKRFPLSPEIGKREHHLRRLIGKLSLPRPVHTGALETFLRQHRLVSW